MEDELILAAMSEALLEADIVVTLNLLFADLATFGIWRDLMLDGICLLTLDPELMEALGASLTLATWATEKRDWFC